MDQIPEIFVVVVAACFGAMIGSFLNVCIYRLPREGLSVGRPTRSFCPACGARIAWYDNLPIVSWFALGGLCRQCRAPISMRYPLVEALTAMLFAVVVHRYLYEVGGSDGGCVVLLVLTAALVVATFIDIDLRILPDEITVGGMHLLPPLMLAFPDLHTHRPDAVVSSLLARLQSSALPLHQALPGFTGTTVGLATLLVVASVVLFLVGCSAYRLYRKVRQPELPRRLRDVSLAGLLTASAGGVLLVACLRPDLLLAPRVYSLTAALLGMASGSGLVFLVGIVGTRVFRKQAMGFGDVKLMGLLGGFAGWWGAPAGFFIACLLGSVIGVARLCLSRDRYLPFGPFLAIGCFLVLFWPGALESAAAWYLGLFR